jgi:glycosyltransferase involved in cell wall biosynthesis
MFVVPLKFCASGRALLATQRPRRNTSSCDWAHLESGSDSYQVQCGNRAERSSMRVDKAPRRGKRTVLFVTNSFSYGGSEKHLLELLRRLDDGNVQSVVLCTDSDPYTQRLKEGCHSSVAVRSEQSLKSIRDWLRVFREIKPDVVVLVYGTLWILPWVAAVAARLAGIQKLYAIHHLMPLPPQDPRILEIKSPRDILRRVFGKRVRKLLTVRVPPHLCNKTICVSNAVRNSLIEQYRFPARKMLTIHNGVSPREFALSRGDGIAIRAELEIHSDEFVLVCTARLSTEKGIDILLSAMGQIIQKDPSCKCIIIGEGSLKEKLLEQVKSLGLGRHVFMEGFRADVRPYLCAADAFVLTSQIEGLPFSVLEAMACGLPCVVTNVGGNAEAVAHNVNGLVVNPSSVDEVVQAIIYLRTHPQERARMAHASRSRVCEEFDIEVRMADIKRLILS